MSVKYVAGGSGGSGGLTPAQIAEDATVKAAFEAKVDRSGASAGQVPVLQAGGTLAFQSVSGSGAVPDASASTKGVLRLAGDLGGTPDAPTVPALANKLDLSAAAELVRDVVAAALVAGPNVAILNDDAGDHITISAFGSGGGGSSYPIVIHGADTGVARPNVAGPVIWIGAVEPANDDDTQDVWIFASADGSGSPGQVDFGDATSTVKGIVKLAGDLSGTASAPTVPGLAGKANTADLKPVATSGVYSDLTGKPASDPVAGTAGLRTLGTGAQQAAAGNHTHDARYPVIVKQSGSSYPARPVGAEIVIWKGTADPGVLALDGDEWRAV